MSVSAEPLPDRATPKTSPSHLLDTLAEVIAEAKARPLTVGEVVGKLQGKGLSLVCLVLALPFLQPLWLGPLSVFGGAAIAMLGWQMARGRSTPWLPAKLEAFVLSDKTWHVLLKAAERLTRIAHRVARPRLRRLIHGRWSQQLSGIVIGLGGLLVVAPFPAIPFSNAFPALAVALVAIAEMEDDGLFLIGAMLTLVGGAVYLAAVSIAAVGGLQWIFDWVSKAVSG
jgi:hypothetical protein